MKVPIRRRSGSMPNLRLALALVVIAFAPALHAVVSNIARTPHVEVQLLAEKPTIAPGEKSMLGLRMKMTEGWHTYWKHPGDSGEATVIEWQTPPGFTAGDIVWPHPERIDVPPLTSYGYSGEILLLVPFSAPADAEAGTTANLVADVFWMACEKTCIPEEAKLRIDVPVAAAPAQPDAEHAAMFAEFRARVPVLDAAWKASATTSADGFQLVVSPPAGRVVDTSKLQFFASEGPLIEYAAPQKPEVRDGAIVIALKKSPYLNAAPTVMRGILVADEPLSATGARAIEIDTKIGLPPAAPPVDADGDSQPLTLWLALALAFAGGVVLNLMPCVFPVVSLKILGFVNSSRDEPRRVRLHGLAFAAGVLVAFWILAGLLIALRAAGEEIGWGFQLQSPPFVAAMAMLIFAIGLALAGVMEIGASLTRLGSAEKRGGGPGSSLLNGMLATVVATPCTAPFMGAALGYALTQSAATSLAIFTALGAGMAAPYVALSMAPGLLRFLPRPGAWMERFKQAMAFPLFATTAWLVWVFGIQTGVDGVLRLLIALTLVALAAWIIGQWATVASATRTRWIARVVAVLVVASAGFIASGADTVSAAPAAVMKDDGIAWEAYSPQRVAELRASGKPFFIDFTAAWCLSCKVNEHVAFDSAEVQAAVRKSGITMLKADWTNRNPEITRALAEFGRSGVPLYVLYGSDPAAPPRVLPEVLTPGIVIAALEEVR